MNSKFISTSLSIEKNGLFITIKYLFSYLFIKLGLQHFVKYKTSKLFIRKNSSDFPVFREIFFELEYDFKFPNDAKVIIDAGANTGMAAVYFTNRFPNAKILSLEPDDENYRMLIKNTEDLKNVVAIKRALWPNNIFLSISDASKDGTAGIQVGEKKDASKSEVLGINIESLLVEYDIKYIDIFKLDIEGAEYEIFINECSTWLSRTKIIIIETHDRFKNYCTKALFDALRDFNYSVKMSGEKLVIYLEH